MFSRHACVLLALAAPAAAQLTASFTSTPTLGPTPLIVTFTDASTTSAPVGITSWAWDLDGDTVVDSTAQHPVWVYSHCGSYHVSLTVTDGTNPPATLTRNHYVRPGSVLATRTDGNTSFGAGGGNFLDANVLHPHGLLICSMDAKNTAALNTPVAVEVYWTPGTYVGVQQVPQAWRLIATGTSNGTGSLTPPVPVALLRPFYLAAGSHGLFIRIVTGGGPQYTQGSFTYANSDLILTLGQSQATPFVSAPANPRTWNGAFYYAACGATGEAGFGLFGAGCAGSRATATQRPTALPRMGQALSVDFDNLPVSVAILMVGLSNTTSSLGPLPVDLATFGAPGCHGRVSPDVAVALVGTANAATWNFNIPGTPGLLNQLFYSQALVLDPGFNGLGAVASDAAAGVIGR